MAIPLTGTVRRVEVPQAARALSTLSRIDYEDTFLLDTRSARDLTGEQWSRAMLEDAPTLVRNALLCAWSVLGLRLGSDRSDRQVLGWELRRSNPEFALLGADARLGLEAELLFKPRRHTLLFATFVEQEDRLARAMWAGIEPAHGPIVRYMLEQAGLRARRHTPDTLAV
jgi:hypothetical protein